MKLEHIRDNIKTIPDVRAHSIARYTDASIYAMPTDQRKKTLAKAIELLREMYGDADHPVVENVEFFRRRHLSDARLRAMLIGIVAVFVIVTIVILAAIFS